MGRQPSPDLLVHYMGARLEKTCPTFYSWSGSKDAPVFTSSIMMLKAHFLDSRRSLQPRRLVDDGKYVGKAWTGSFNYPALTC
jgi:hypothetical protein